MVSAVGSSQVSNTNASSGPSKSGLEAQISRYQQQLTDCVTCPSSKTPEGKAAIESLSNKISVVQSKLKEITDNTPKQTSTSQNLSQDNTAKSSASNENHTTQSEPDESKVGHLVNVYA